MATPVPSATAIARLKRVTAATVDPKMQDADIVDALVQYALVDSAGVLPGDAGWLETYDLNGAAAEVWGWKEAAASAMVAINADGSQLNLAQITDHCRSQKLYYQNQRGWGTITVAGSGT